MATTRPQTKGPSEKFCMLLVAELLLEDDPEAPLAVVVGCPLPADAVPVLPAPES